MYSFAYAIIIIYCYVKRNDFLTWCISGLIFL